MLADIVFNLALLFADGAVLFAFCKGPSPSRAVRVLGGLGVIALGLGVALPLLLGGSGFGVMRLWAWAIFLHGPLVCVVLARGLREHARWRVAGGTLAALLVLIAIDAFWIEPHWLECSRVEIASEKLSRPVRIVLVADLQTDQVGDYERGVMERAVAEQPDLLLFAGDYLHFADPLGEEAAEQRKKLHELFAEIRLDAPLGVLAVGGNVDAPGWPELFDGLGVQCHERGARVELGELVLTTLSLSGSTRTDLTVPAEERFHVVLGHVPNFALGDVHADLLLAGHCHGGQVRLPVLGPPLTLARIPRSWASGAREIRPGTTLLVSRGVGMERADAPRLRFLCRPELVVIDLVPAAGVARSEG